MFVPGLPEPLPDLSPDEQAELDALSHLSDDALWEIAAEQMSGSSQERALELMRRNSNGSITLDEYSELQHLVERADRLRLRKAEAASILLQRGHKFSPEDFKPATLHISDDW